MKKTFVVLLVFCTHSVHASTNLDIAINDVRHKCGNISSELNDIKKLAGINTAVTAAGTLTAGVGLATGIAKSNKDKEIEELRKEIERLKKLRAKNPVEKLTLQDPAVFQQQLSDFVASYSDAFSQKEQELTEAEKKSKTLGNVRTGMLATSAATNIAGTIIAANNRVKGDLKSQINSCLTAVTDLSRVKIQAHISQTATENDLKVAENIISACQEWETVDIDSINKRSTGATVAGGLGAGFGVAGTVASAYANSNSVRVDGGDKEKKLNNAANILAGGTTIASGGAVIFNATQISAVKRAVKVAAQCEEALKQ